MFDVYIFYGRTAPWFKNFNMSGGVPGGLRPPGPPQDGQNIKKNAFLTKIWWVQKVAKFGPPP